MAGSDARDGPAREAESRSGLARDIAALRREVRALSKAVERLWQLAERATSIDLYLRSRGVHSIARVSEPVLLPRSATAQERYYCLLRHYSFRLFLRDVIRHGSDFGVRDLTRYCSEPVARDYLLALRRWGLVRAVGGGRFALRAADIRSFGPTLEWFVANVLVREFGMVAAHGLRLNGAVGGGDFDVIARWGDRLVYVETKASPPRNIERSQVDAFLQRVAALSPEMAVFLNDTQLRMADKIAVLFGESLRAQASDLGLPDRRPRRLQRELFTIGGRIFIANAEPDLVANLGACLAHFARERSAGREEAI